MNFHLLLNFVLPILLVVACGFGLFVAALRAIDRPMPTIIRRTGSAMSCLYLIGFPAWIILRSASGG